MKRHGLILVPDHVPTLRPWIANRLPMVLPSDWKLEDERLDGRAYANAGRQLFVIVSAGTEKDGLRWIHFSVSHRLRLPTWEELVEVKELFLGRETKAIQVVPRRSEYVNLHPFVLHLFVCADEEKSPIPDFTRGSGTL